MARVGAVEHVEADGRVRLELSDGDTSTSDRFAPSGDDSPPLPGDGAVAVPLPGAGRTAAVGYEDDSDKVAAPGEKRSYARSSDGELVAEIYLRGDGTIVLRNLQAGTTVELKGDGTVTSSGEIVAREGAAQVGVTSHKTASPFGPLDVIPGT